MLRGNAVLLGLWRGIYHGWDPVGGRRPEGRAGCELRHVLTSYPIYLVLRPCPTSAPIALGWPQQCSLPDGPSLPPTHQEADSPKWPREGHS